ncbi:MAG: Asp-tRNA(Asn)/Glu-tRNA(Gln) amidotransferase subunit GatC [Alphaproteobacteria bacterium]|nr:Asp-tRNA(Asn)/Glu-tRNA(Gln) amidotransferase subunit GatC [Alphaproteobacteria bacterium]
MDLLNTLKKVCRTACLANEQGKGMPNVQEIKDIIDMIHLISEVEVSHVEPMYLPTEELLKNKPMRDDVAQDDVATNVILANSPEQREGFFVLPKVID